MDNNHLIADFMGLTYEIKTLIAPHGSQQEIKYYSYKDEWGHEVINLRYHKSWDALMPVISKIGEVYIDIPFESEYLGEATDLINELHNTFLDPNIDSAYTLAFRFIEVYNKIEK